MRLKVNNVREAIAMVRDRLSSMNGRCVVVTEYGDTLCVYGKRDGSHCAIGWLIDAPKDDQVWDYHGAVEGVVRDFDITWADGREIELRGDEMETLAYLQTIHDQASNWYDGKFVEWDEFEKLLERGHWRYNNNA